MHHDCCQQSRPYGIAFLAMSSRQHWGQYVQKVKLCSSQPVSGGQRRLRVASVIPPNAVIRSTRKGSRSCSGAGWLEPRAAVRGADSMEFRRAVGLMQYSRPTRSNQDGNDSSGCGGGHTGHGRNMTARRPPRAVAHSPDRSLPRLFARSHPRSPSQRRAPRAR